MKVIEFYLNVFHYCFYKIHYKIHTIFNKVNPSWLLMKIPYIKNKHKEKGIDIRKEIESMYSNKNYGFSVMVSGGILWGLVSTLLFSILLIFNIPISDTYTVGLFCFIISGYICYVFVFKQDKYIAYFKEYEKWSREEKIKFVWLTLASVFVVFFLFYLGLVMW